MPPPTRLAIKSLLNGIILAPTLECFLTNIASTLANVLTLISRGYLQLEVFEIIVNWKIMVR